MTGVEDSSELPERPDVRMDTVGLTAEEVARCGLSELDLLDWPVRP